MFNNMKTLFLKTISPFKSKLDIVPTTSLQENTLTPTPLAMNHSTIRIKDEIINLDGEDDIEMSISTVSNTTQSIQINNSISYQEPNNNNSNNDERGEEEEKKKRDEIFKQFKDYDEMEEKGVDDDDLLLLKVTMGELDNEKIIEKYISTPNKSIDVIMKEKKILDRNGKLIQSKEEAMDENKRPFIKKPAEINRYFIGSEAVKCGKCGVFNQHFSFECPLDSVSDKTSNSKSSSKSTKDYPCYRCGEFGHYIGTCTSYVCFKCGLYGHYPKFCDRYYQKYLMDSDYKGLGKLYENDRNDDYKTIYNKMYSRSNSNGNFKDKPFNDKYSRKFDKKDRYGSRKYRDRDYNNNNYNNNNNNYNNNNYNNNSQSMKYKSKKKQSYQDNNNYNNNNNKIKKTKDKESKKNKPDKYREKIKNDHRSKKGDNSSSDKKKKRNREFSSKDKSQKKYKNK